MILRRLTSLTALVVFLNLLPASQGSLFAQTAHADSAANGPSHIVIAKKAKRAPRASSSITVTNIRHHDHKKYTRVVLDLPARAIIKESRDNKKEQATIALSKSRLSKRALRKIQSKKFPKAIAIKEEAGQTVKVTLDLSALKTYTLQTLRRPNRVVIDLFYSKKKKGVVAKKTPSLAAKPKKPSIAKHAPKAAPSSKPAKATNKPPAKKVASARSSTSSATPRPTKKPDGQPKPAATYPPKNTPKTKPVVPPPNPASSSKAPASSGTKPASPPSPFSVARHVKDLVVVIDPGHGGRDPGAIGKKGTKEKHITLKIGNYLKDLIQKRLGSKVFLTRTTDTFLDLERRVEFANKKKADIFISIHVNSHPQTRIKGLEVYHFGKASDPRALEVAARENGMKLEDDAPPWQFIIADKLNDQKIEQSQTFAWTTNKTLVKTLKASYTIKDHGVKTAPFYVLRFTTMPSILAEVAFVSNPEEEKRLRSNAFQKRIAEGIYQGIRSYLKTAFPALS